MGFLDKVKEGAAQATAVAKDAAQKGQAKLDAMQSKKAADGLLHDLGAAAYAEKTGRGAANNSAEIDRILGRPREARAGERPGRSHHELDDVRGGPSVGRPEPKLPGAGAVGSPGTRPRIGPPTSATGPLATPRWTG